MVGADPSENAESSPRPRLRLPWFLFVGALVWSIVIRVPLILNAETHLDSDLAVDGLTLLDATNGHWRWHYPGTPHIGTASVALAFPFASVRGATPATLGLAGAVNNGLLMLAAFLLAGRVFGPRVAGWSLIPLAFASTGTIWLSGRITGGHLLAAAWHAGAFALLHGNLKHGGIGRGLLLGLWCGLGLWNDSMFLMSLVGLVPAGIRAWWLAGRSKRGLLAGAAFLVGVVVGLVPKFVGSRVDPYDAYGEQFAPIWRTDVLLEHAEILRFDCLPRLIVGRRLRGLEADPSNLVVDRRSRLTGEGFAAIVLVGLGLSLFAVATASLLKDREADPDRARFAVRWGLLITSAAVLAGFVVNRNIFNSDNYRYLVFLLVPWALGCGRFLAGLSRRGEGGMACAGLIGAAFALLITVDTATWYRRFGWLDSGLRPIVRKLDDPFLNWLVAHPEVHDLYGDYWDVYRLGWLTGGRVRGVPSPRFPSRFPDPSQPKPEYILVRPTPIGLELRAEAIRDGGTEVFRAAGGSILRRPVP